MNIIINYYTVAMSGPVSVNNKLILFLFSPIFKPGAHWPQAGAHLVSYNHFHCAKVCVCVCVSVCMCVYAPEAINT